jgi:2-dehydro-3-deoxygluconokinase
MGRASTAVCIGETMAVLVPEQAGPLDEVRTFRHAYGGAESNVARALAGLGISAAWVSRVGDDGFGRRIVNDLAAAGVDTRAVVVDPDRPTGLYFKERGPGGSTPHYYRAGSAASALGPEILDDPVTSALLDRAGLIHVSGITAALSPTARALLQALLPHPSHPGHPPAHAPYPAGERPRSTLGSPCDPAGESAHGLQPGNPANGVNPPDVAERSSLGPRVLSGDAGRPAGGGGAAGRRRALVSFDLNWRPALWRGRDTAPLRELLNAADVVLMGADEAATVLGTGDPGELRRLLPGPSALVVKDGGVTATVVEADGSVSEPALRVEVVEPVGAGDAFAAGYLAGTLRGYDRRRRLRLGHLMAAVTLVVHGDHAPPPPAGVVGSLLSCSAREWARTVVTAAGVHR